MPRRGPYKQYEVNASIAVPKSTLHDRRKRRLVEVDIGDSVDNGLLHLISVPPPIEDIVPQHPHPEEFRTDKILALRNSSQMICLL